MPFLLYIAYQNMLTLRTGNAPKQKEGWSLLLLANIGHRILTNEKGLPDNPFTIFA